MAKTKPPAAPARSTINVVCVRQGQTKDLKKLVVFREVTGTVDAPALGRELALAVTSFKMVKPYPGNVYSLEYPADDPDVFYPASLKYVGEYYNAAEVNEWQAAWQAQSIAAREEAMVKRANSPTSGLDKHIRALRHAYQHLAPSDRLPFQVWLLHELRASL